MKWVWAAAWLLLFSGCRSEEAPAYPNGQRPPASAKCFYIHENAVNLHFDPAVDVGFGAFSLLTYDVDLKVHADDFVNTVRQRLQTQGWYPVEWDLQLSQRLEGWKKLPLSEDPSRVGDDESLKLWWINKKLEAFDFSLFHWASRKDKGPKYSITMRYCEPTGATRIVERYRRLLGFPWEPHATTTPTSLPVESPLEF